MAKRRIIIDKNQFEALLKIGCRRNEIIAYMNMTIPGGCSHDSIERWCKKEYGETFAMILDKNKEIERVTVREAMHKAIEKGNTAAIIFAAKNILGWSDHPEEAEDTEDSDRYFEEAGL